MTKFFVRESVVDEPVKAFWFQWLTKPDLWPLCAPMDHKVGSYYSRLEQADNVTSGHSNLSPHCLVTKHSFKLGLESWNMPPACLSSCNQPTWLWHVDSSHVHTWWRMHCVSKACLHVSLTGVLSGSMQLTPSDRPFTPSFIVAGTD